MLDLVNSRHAEKRLNQRGLRPHDVDREILRRKREIQQLEKLRGMKLVVVGETLVTAYRSKQTDQRRTIRRGRETK